MPTGVYVRGTRGPLSSETKAKISAANRGCKHSAESRAHMSLAHRGKRRPLSPETIAKISASNTGKIRSAEARAHLSASQTGKTLSFEHREKCAAALRGRSRPPFSEEWRRRIGQAGIGRIASAETRAKRSESLKRAWGEGRHSINKSYRYTSLAQRLRAILEGTLGISLEPEIRFGRFSADLYDRANHVAYEADGRYWHDRNEAAHPGYHAERDGYLRDRFGLPVIRYNELDIRAMEKRGVA
jgi:very-short-patch-repair endonuclease